jgi:O-antigen ligase
MATRPRLADGWRWSRSKLPSRRPSPFRSTLLTALVAVTLSALVGVAMVRLGTAQRELKALLIMVAAVAMVVAALRPQVGLTILLILMPFEFHFSGTGTNEVVVVAMALVLVWRINASAIPGWIAVGGGALVLGSFIAAIGAHDHTGALWGAVRWLAAIILLFAAISVFRGNRDASRRMVDIFTGSALVVVLFAFAQRAGVYTLVGPPYFSGHPNSFFGVYTVYAGYTAMAAVLATGEVLIAVNQRRMTRAGMYGAALVVILIGIAISTSRGGLLALAGGWLFLLVLNFRRGTVVMQACAILFIFLVAGYLATPRSTIVTIQERLSVQSSADVEDKTRFALQKAGEQALGAHPFGLGYENFPFYLREHVHSAYIQMAFDHAHETPVQIGLDAGWLGLVGFLILWGWPILKVLAHGRGGPSAVRATVFAAALGGFMAQGLFDYLFYEIDFLIFFVAMVWGAIHALSVDRATVPTRLPRLLPLLDGDRGERGERRAGGVVAVHVAEAPTAVVV